MNSYTRKLSYNLSCRLRLKCDGTRAESRFRLHAERTSPFNAAGASVQSKTGSRSVCIGGSNTGYTMFRGSVKGTGYSLHSPVSPSLALPCVTVCHHISTGLYDIILFIKKRLRMDKLAACFSCLVIVPPAGRYGGQTAVGTRDAFLLQNTQTLALG